MLFWFFKELTLLYLYSYYSFISWDVFKVQKNVVLVSISVLDVWSVFDLSKLYIEQLVQVCSLLQSSEPNLPLQAIR